MWSEQIGKSTWRHNGSSGPEKLTAIRSEINDRTEEDGIEDP